MTDATLPSSDAGYSAWPHRLAVLLVCATFPLIWVGGLVTTYDAGMAVPDWPNTFGTNLFLYPWQSWIAGPWDLFIEHGHRLLGSLVGMIAIGLVVAVWCADRRRWMRGLAITALLLVVLQGVLGGQRVLQDDRRIAQIHGCVGPLFLTLAVTMAALTSRWWQRVEELESRSISRRFVVGCWLTFGLATLQLLLGSQLRHGIDYLSAGVFQASVLFHVVVAFLLTFQVLWSALSLRRTVASQRLRWPVLALVVLVSAQVVLGVGTWAMKYGWPTILYDVFPNPGFTVQAESMAQSLTVTAHVAMGSFILALSGWLAVRSSRLLFVDGVRSRLAAKNGASQPLAGAVG